MSSITGPGLPPFWRYLAFLSFSFPSALFGFRLDGLCKALQNTRSALYFEWSIGVDNPFL